MKNSKRILSITIKRTIDDSPDTSWLGEYSDTRKSEFSIDRAHTEECASQNSEAVVDKLERAISHLNNEHFSSLDAAIVESIGEAIDILISAQDEASECDCGSGGNWSRHEYRYFNPGSVEKFDPTASWIPTTEADKRAYWLAAMRENAHKDYERMEEINSGSVGFVCIAAVAEVQLAGNLIQEISSGYLCGIESDSDESYFKEVAGEQLHELKAQLSAMEFSKRAIATAVKNLTETE